MAVPSNLMEALKKLDKASLDISSIEGEASVGVKMHIAGLLFFFIFHKESFAHSIGKRIKLVRVDAEETSASVDVVSKGTNAEGKVRRSATVICECPVEQGKQLPSEANKLVQWVTMIRYGEWSWKYAWRLHGLSYRYSTFNCLE